MECIQKDQYLKYHPDTMDFMRKKYSFDKPGEMDAAVDLLQDWLKKQEHFLKKDFPRSYLERQIILSKGSVERAKLQMDKICTLRTLLPQYFEKCDAKNDLKPLEGYDNFQVLLKDLTDDHYRIYATKLQPNGKLSSKMYLISYFYAILIGEYIRVKDYCDGLVLILDLRGVNIVHCASEINVNELRQTATISMDGFGARVKNIHIISESKFIDILVKIFKQIVSSKIGNRIQVHSTVDELHQYIPKKILPADLGGDGKTMNELYAEFTEELSSPENVRHFKEMRNVRTDESLRSSATFNEQYLGLAGSFRTLNVD